MCATLAVFVGRDGAWAQDALQGVAARKESVNLGGRGLSAGSFSRTMQSADNPVQFSARAGIASDYIYRGVTLSDRKPAYGAGIEAAFGNFYAGATAASVELPSQPNAEISFAGGYRPSIGNVDFDFGVTYYLYPGEISGSKIEYWEASARADTKLTDTLRVAGGVAYSPSVSNTGAWGWYAATGFEVDLPVRLLPNTGVTFSAAAGYSWFGFQSPDLGGFRLPDYLNWHAGLSFNYRNATLDLRYHDTNLSKGNCYVFTGDPGATAGGKIDPVTNPGGLQSRWCSAAFVAKLVFSN